MTGKATELLNGTAQTGTQILPMTYCLLSTYYVPEIYFTEQETGTQRSEPFKVTQVLRVRAEIQARRCLIQQLKHFFSALDGLPDQGPHALQGSHWVSGTAHLGLLTSFSGRRGMVWHCSVVQTGVIVSVSMTHSHAASQGGRRDSKIRSLRESVRNTAHRPTPAKCSPTDRWASCNCEEKGPPAGSSSLTC